MPSHYVDTTFPDVWDIIAICYSQKQYQSRSVGVLWLQEKCPIQKLEAKASVSFVEEKKVSVGEKRKDRQMVAKYDIGNLAC